MINTIYANAYCKEDISLIENYDKAINDTIETWECHHKDEIRTLPSGMVVIRTRQDLIDNGRYYHCPANELIFLKHEEHSRLHALNRSEELKCKINAFNSSRKGEPRSKETRNKISNKLKGIRRSKLAWNKGTKLSKEGKVKLSLAHFTEFGLKYYNKYKLLRKDNNALYLREYKYYKKHNKCSWE